MYSDPSGHMPEWAQWVLGGALVVLGVAASIALSVSAAPALIGVLSSALGSGLAGSIVGGAVIGAASGAISGALMNAGIQTISDGFENIDLGEVGRSTLSGAISGAIAGGIFGGIKHVYSAERLASSASGLNSAKTQMSQALSYSSGAARISNARFIENVVKYNAAYVNNVIAKGTSAIYTLAFNGLYAGFQFGLKQFIGSGLNQIW